MKKETYHGWTNKETWSAKLWFDNDYYNLIMEKIEELKEEYEDEEEIIHELAKWIREIIEIDNPLADENNLYSELLNDSLSEINGYEIAKSYLEE